MTSPADGILPERKAGGDTLYYLMAAIFGAGAAWTDIKVGDLLLTAMIVVAACIYTQVDPASSALASG